VKFPNPTDNLIAKGFRFGHRGAHSSRTMMVADLVTLFAHCPEQANRAMLKAAIVDDNLLGKNTVSTRTEAFERLSALYLLDPSKAMFTGLRWFWKQSADSRPMLALLTAVARDPLLRATVPTVQAMTVGATYDKVEVAEAIRTIDPEHFKPAILNKIAVNAGASWTQAGFLVGRAVKRRVRPVLTPAAVAYALYLGRLEDRSGDRLLDTIWTGLLDHPRHQIEAVAQDAAARQLLDYRRAGSVRDISFRRLETARGQG
jgi:hypothetical protein